jgi:hypothetical protein
MPLRREACGLWGKAVSEFFDEALELAGWAWAIQAQQAPRDVSVTLDQSEPAIFSPQPPLGFRARGIRNSAMRDRK